MTKYAESFTIQVSYSPQFLLEAVEESFRLNNISIEVSNADNDSGIVEVEGRTAFGIFVYPQKVTVKIEVMDSSSVFHIAANVFQLTIHNPTKTTVNTIWKCIIDTIVRKTQFEESVNRITLGELKEKLENLKKVYVDKVLNESEIQVALDELLKVVAQKGLSTEPLRDYLLLMLDYIEDFPEEKFKEVIAHIKEFKQKDTQATTMTESEEKYRNAMELGEESIGECQLKAEALRNIYEETDADDKENIVEHYKRIKKKIIILKLQSDYKTLMKAPEQNVAECERKLQNLEAFCAKTKGKSKIKINNKINELKAKIIQLKRKNRKRNKLIVIGMGIMVGTVIAIWIGIRYYSHLQSTNTEDALYNASVNRNDKDLFQNYLGLYGIEGRHSKEVARALKKIEETSAFNQAKKVHTLQAYKDYIKEFGQSAIYYQDAIGAIKQIETRKNVRENRDHNAYRKAVRIGTAKAYKNYIENFGEGGLHYKEALDSKKLLILEADKRDYNIAKRKNSTKAYNEYINHYGKYGRYYREALNAIRVIDDAIAEKKENEFWENIENKNTIQEYQSYLRRYPSALHSATARQRIFDIQEKDQIFAKQKRIKKEKERLIQFYSRRMVLIHDGSFMMGSRYADGQEDEKPAHRVVITKSFFLGKFEVTQGEWKSIMNTAPWKEKSYIKEGDDFPATCLSWDQIQDFIRKLNKMTGLSFRLPTEAEWEYACRAGTKTKYYWGNKMDGNYCWWYGNAWKKGERYAHEVGQKQCNNFGLYDMIGNVAELCADWHGKNYYSISPPQDPEGSPTGDRSPNPFLHPFKVSRGGSWVREAYLCRSANRYVSYISPYEIGFRLARTKK